MSEHTQDGQVQSQAWPRPSGPSAEADVTPARTETASADAGTPTASVATAADAGEPAEAAAEAPAEAPVGELPGPHDTAVGAPPELSSVVEAVLLVADEPVSAVVLAQVAEQPVAAVERALRELSDAYTARGSGIDVREVAGGWRLYTRAESAPWVERFVRDGQQARLTQAALETLAVVAYRQPVTRGRVSAVRGVNVDGVVRSLVSRGLLAESGADPETGGTLYVTTPLFLHKLGITSLEQLPSLAPLLPELDEFEQDSMST